MVLKRTFWPKRPFLRGGAFSEEGKWLASEKWTSQDSRLGEAGVFAIGGPLERGPPGKMGALHPFSRQKQGFWPDLVHFRGKWSKFGHFSGWGPLVFPANFGLRVKIGRISGRFWQVLVEFGQNWSILIKWSKMVIFDQDRPKSNRQSVLLTGFGRFWSFWHDRFWGIFGSKSADFGEFQNWGRIGPFLGGGSSKKLHVVERMGWGGCRPWGLRPGPFRDPAGPLGRTTCRFWDLAELEISVSVDWLKLHEVRVFQPSAEISSKFLGRLGPVNRHFP